MGAPDAELHAGTGFPLPVWDEHRPPHGEVTWVEGDERIVSTSGPSIQLFIDLYIPRCAGDEIFVAVRLRDTGGYIPAGDPEYKDDEDNLSVTAVLFLPADGRASRVEAILPYVVMPQGAGGLMECEIAVFDDEGELVALSYYPVELPDDVDRSPDLLTVMTHTLTALVRSEGALTRDAVRTIRTLLQDNFELDELGDAFLRRILKIANKTHHSYQTLAEVVDLVVPTAAHPRFVNLLYACARSHDGEVSRRKQRFIDGLLAECDIHDHHKLGSKGLIRHYEALEMEPGAEWDEVKKQYRRMIRDYHPDKVSGLAQGFQDYANKRTQAFNEAYGELEKALVKAAAPEATVEIDLD